MSKATVHSINTARLCIFNTNKRSPMSQNVAYVISNARSRNWIEIQILNALLASCGTRDVVMTIEHNFGCIHMRLASMFNKQLAFEEDIRRYSF